MSRDDNLSNAPSNDSGYNSYMTQYLDPFACGELYSPSLNPDGSGMYPSSVAESNSIALPTPMVDAGDYMFAEVTNSPTQSHPAAFVQQDSELMRYPTQSGLDSAHSSWSGQGVPDYTGVSGGGFTDDHDMSDFNGPQGYSAAMGSVSNYADQDAGIDTQTGHQAGIAQSTRSMLDLPTTRRESRGRQSSNPSPFMSRRVSGTGETGATNDPAMLSPVSATQTPFNMRLESFDDFNERSTTGSIIISDDNTEDTLNGTKGPANSTVEETAARSSELYQAVQAADDFYHCPFESEGCLHKPTKLKCNYDKYIDSHLRPFRCRQNSCDNAQFSSTACLLRHEREAHGMHGHGQKPHLCHYQDCERSNIGKGFPRRYNLLDHMKRVHKHPGETVASRPGSRKKKQSDNDVMPERTRKPASRSTAKAERAVQIRLQREMEYKKQWNERKMSLLERVQNIKGHSDATSMGQCSEDIKAMQELSEKLYNLT